MDSFMSLFTEAESVSSKASDSYVEVTLAKDGTKATVYAGKGSKFVWFSTFGEPVDLKLITKKVVGVIQ